MAGQVISAIQNKGGAGKTTLLISLISLLEEDGAKISIVDTDPSGDLSGWAKKARNKGNFRGNLLPDMLDESDLVPVVRKEQKVSDIVFIDSAGIDTQMTMFAAGVSDLVLIPCPASERDALAALKTVKKTKSVADVAGRDIPAKIIMNNVDPRTNIFNVVKGQLERAEAPLLDALMRRRTGFAEFQTLGCGPSGSARSVVSSVIANLQLLNLLNFYRPENIVGMAL